MPDKKENFFSKYWNLLSNIAIGLIAVISGFAIPPKINAHILQDDINYEMMCKFVLAGILGLFLLLCNHFKAKKYTLKWAIASIVVLIVSLYIHGRYNSYYNSHTTLHEEAQTKVITGDHYLPVAVRAIDIYKSKHGGIEPAKKEIVSSLNYPEGIWSNNELGRVYGNIVILYMAQVILFSLFAFFVVQSIYCFTGKSMMV